MVNVWLFYIRILLLLIMALSMLVGVCFSFRLVRLRSLCKKKVQAGLYVDKTVESNTEHATNRRFSFPCFMDDAGHKYQVRKGMREIVCEGGSNIDLYVSEDFSKFYCNKQYQEDKTDIIKVFMYAVISGLGWFCLGYGLWLMPVVGVMLFTMLPVLLGGVLDHCCIKTSFFQKHKHPIDSGKQVHGKRVFGDNKTWIGLFSMILSCVVSTALCGFAVSYLHLENWTDIYLQHANTLGYTLLFGAVIGLVYELCELPNSFLKRQLDIKPGLSGSGLVGKLFFVVDQIDSTVGLSLVLHYLSGITWGKTLLYIVFGGVMHCLLDVVLYLVGLRKNMF